MRLKRHFLLFSVGIILPSVFLIYLGFSSLAAEKEVREKEVAERLGSSVEYWVTQVDAALQAAMEEHKGWQVSAVMDAQERWIDPFHESLEFSWPDLPARRAARLAVIEHTENSEKDYTKAADAYNFLAWDLESEPWKATLLLRAAGCWRKAHAWAQAEESLKHIGRGFSDVRNDRGIPFGLLAATDLADVYAASGQINLAIDKALDTLAAIQRRAWILAWKDEKIFAQRLHGHLSEWAPQMTEVQHTRWRSLAQTLNARAERVQMLEVWKADDWPRVQAILRAQGRMDQPTLVWPDHDEDLALWIHPEIDPDSGLRVRTQIAWCKREVIEELWRHSVRGSSIEAGFTAQLHPVSKSAVDGVKRRFDRIVPPMEFCVQATGSSHDAYVATRKKIFWTILFMTGVIFIVSLRVSWQSLEREMEVSWLKVRFIDNVTLKIKTPLSIIEFIAQKMKLKGYKNSQEAEEYYHLLQEDTARLKHVTEDVLDFSRLLDNRVPYPFVKFDWGPSLRRTIDIFLKSKLWRGVTIEYTSALSTCLIEGHEEVLARAVLNVLENAVHYSPSDRMAIQVLLRREEDHAVLDIVDQGDGISRSEQTLVFDRFYRGASAQERSIAGAGLGLTVARYIIQAHHGTITLQSTLGKGSTFTIRLPLFPG
jgi:signal transduction histidine kinase